MIGSDKCGLRERELYGGRSLGRAAADWPRAAGDSVSVETERSEFPPGTAYRLVLKPAGTMQFHFFIAGFHVGTVGAWQTMVGVCAAGSDSEFNGTIL